MGMGLAGAYGVAGGHEALQKLLAERFLQQLREQQQALQIRQQAETERRNAAVEAETKRQNEAQQQSLNDLRTQETQTARLNAARQLAPLVQPHTSLSPEAAQLFNQIGLTKTNPPAAFPAGVEPLGGPPVYVPGEQPGTVFTGTAEQNQKIQQADEARRFEATAPPFLRAASQYHRVTGTNPPTAPKTLADIEAEAEARARGGRRGAPPFNQPGPTNLETPYQKVLDMAMVGLPAIQQRNINQSFARLAEQKDTEGTKQLIKQVALQTTPVAIRSQVLGREGTIRELGNLRQEIRTLQNAGVPTDFLTGTVEDVVRKLGSTQNPAYVRLATRLQNTLIQYRRQATGVQFGEREEQQYERMFPNYRNLPVVNLAMIEGLEGALKDNQRSFWEQRLGPEGAQLLEPSTSTQTAYQRYLQRTQTR